MLCWAFGLGATAQGLAGIKNLDRAYLVQAGYGPFTSAGDLGDRYGGGLAIDGALLYLPNNASWQFGLMAQYGFGTEVREDVLADLRTDAGFVIGDQRQPAEIRLRQRQLFIGPRLGYTVRIGANRRAGLHLATGLGYFYSRIRFQQDPVQIVPQLVKAAQGGYDRLAGGPAVYQFVGYQQLALDRRLNFFLGAEITAALARQLRNYDVNLGGPPPSDGRVDLVLGLRAGIILPIYRGEGTEIFY